MSRNKVYDPRLAEILTEILSLSVIWQDEATGEDVDMAFNTLVGSLTTSYYVARATGYKKNEELAEALLDMAAIAAVLVLAIDAHGSE